MLRKCGRIRRLVVLAIIAFLLALPVTWFLGMHPFQSISDWERWGYCDGMESLEACADKITTAWLFWRKFPTFWGVIMGGLTLFYISGKLLVWTIRKLIMPKDVIVVNQQLSNIAAYMDKLEIVSLAVKNYTFLSDIKINKINFSKDIFECFEENKELFNALDFDGTPYDLQQQFFALANAAPISEAEFNQNIGYEIMHFSFYFYADKETRKSGIHSFPVDFIAYAPYVNQPYLLFDTKKPYTTDFFETILYAKPLNENEPRFTLFKQALNVVNNFIENDGKEEVIDKNARFDELLTLLESPKYIEPEYLAEAKQRYQQFNEDPKKLFAELVRNDFAYEEDAFENSVKLFFLKVYFNHYNDDWKIDYEALSDFISASTGKPFEITFEEAEHEFEPIKAKVENETDYTLLDVDTGGDETLFLICRKAAEFRVLEIARMLAFPIEG